MIDEVKIVGVDYSSTNTGICVLNNKGDYLYSYLITPNKKMTFDERILYIHSILIDIIDDVGNVVVGIESPALFAKGRVVDLASGYGMLKYSILNKEIKLYEFTPSAIKKFATGNGRASKDDIINKLPKEVYDDFKLVNEKKIDDLADSYYIAKMTLKKYLTTS